VVGVCVNGAVAVLVGDAVIVAVGTSTISGGAGEGRVNQ
jgi:hypothetical protein